MSFETTATKIPFWVILVFIILILTAASGLWYYNIDSNDAKLVGLVGGIISGFIVYLMTFITLIYPIRRLDYYRNMGVKGLLENRHNIYYYRSIVEKGRERVDVMGASCSRFVQDFLDPDSDDRILVNALGEHRNLKVRLLAPDDEHMSIDAIAKIRRTLEKVEQLKVMFGDRVEIRRFAGAAHHSFVVVDDEVVAGPIFNEDQSRHAPAVHVLASTMFGTKYIRHFDSIWNANRDDA